VWDCKRVADAVIKGALLCGEHAVVELEKLMLARAINRPS
jgi:mevalonate kinase